MNESRSLLRRIVYVAYGVFCYAMFQAATLYAIGFVGNFWQSFGFSGPLLHSIDFGGAPEPIGKALLIDGLLLGVFAVQHSVMARQGFKRWWTRVVPPPIERSTFVLMSSLCLFLLFWQWRPIGAIVLWDFSGGPLQILAIALSIFGWFTAASATHMTDHYELFGLRQVLRAFRGTAAPPTEFSTRALYKVVRHPLYMGFVIAFWATPIMTVGHLLFAAGTTAYIFLGIGLEERDLIRHYGDVYRAYRARVRMLLPFPRRASAVTSDGQHTRTPVG